MGFKHRVSLTDMYGQIIGSQLRVSSADKYDWKLIAT